MSAKKQQVQELQIGFIGCGRLARVLIRGLITSKTFAGSEIAASDISFESLLEFSGQTPIQVATNNLQIPLKCKNILLAVKPFNVKEVLQEIKKAITPEHLVISVAAGVPLDAITPFAPAAVRVSITTEINMKNATTPAVRKSPITNAASTASATSSFIRISPARKSSSAVFKIGTIRISAPTAALTSRISGLDGYTQPAR